MKNIIKILSLICIFLLLCGCISDTDYSEYEDLESDYENCQEELYSLSEELEYKEKDINYLLNYVKKLEKDNAVPTYQFNDTWSVDDYFNFSFYYDKKYNLLNYNFKTQEGEKIFLFDFDNTHKINNLTVGVYRSDGYFESFNARYDGDSLFEVPDYNYSYEILLIATVNNKIYRATYKISAKEIKK